MKTLLHGLEQVRPHLKLGTLLLPSARFTYVGRNDRGLEVTSSARAALAAMDGARTCQELSEAVGIPLSDIIDLVSELDRAGLVDTESSRISVRARFHSPNANRASHDNDDSHDGAFQQLQTKLAPELSSATWLAGVRDGGVRVVNRRQEWHVSIYGESRIAILLFGILLSSGISHTTLHGHNEFKRISEADLCAGFLHPGDIGLLLEGRAHELVRELSLFPVSPPSKSNDGHLQQIMVAVGTVPAHLLQEWMSQAVPHLLIDNPESESITIGPIVIPGETPCLRCIAMAREDQNPAWKEIALQKLLAPTKEVPVSVAHHVAGIAAVELLGFIDEHQSHLVGSSAQINYHQPLLSTQRSFTRHPACGCNW